MLAKSRWLFSKIELSCGKCGAAAPLGTAVCPSCGEPMTAGQEKRERASADYFVLSVIPVMYLAMFSMLVSGQFSSRRALAYCSAAKSDLSNYQIAQWAYFTDHNMYTTATSGDGIPGFRPTQNVTLAHAPGSPTKDGFTVTAWHSGCDDDGDGKPDVFTFDDTKGGLQK